jgi:hypothetical protein
MRIIKHPWHDYMITFILLRKQKYCQWQQLPYNFIPIVKFECFFDLFKLFALVPLWFGSCPLIVFVSEVNCALKSRNAILRPKSETRPR